MKPLYRALYGILKSCMILLIFIFSGCDMLQFGLGDKVDLNPPEITVDAEDNFYLRGDYTLQGTITDDISVKSLQVNFKSTQGSDNTLSATISGSNWSVLIPSGGGAPEDIEEGEQILLVEGRDGSGKTTSMEKVCRVDNHIPTVLVSSPLSYVQAGDTSGIVMSKYIDLKGEVFDEFPLEEVRVQILDKLNNVLAEEVADGTNSWFARFLLKSSSDSAFRNQLIDGSFYGYRVIATDGAGNESTGYLHRDDFYDMIPGLNIFPSIDEIGKADLDLAIAGSEVRSHGQLEEYRHYSNAQSGQLPLAGFFYSSADMPEVSYQNLEAGIVSEIFKGADIIGYIDPAANGPAIDASSINVTLYRTGLADPYLSLVNNRNDLSDGIGITEMGDSVNFTIPLMKDGVSLPADTYEITIAAADEEGTPAQLQTVTFKIISGSYPDLQIVSPDPATIPVYNNEFQISGTGASVAPEDWYIRFTLDSHLDDYEVSDSSYSGTPAADGSLNWTYTMGSHVFDGLSEGMHVLYINLSGAEATLRFKKDTQGPVIEIIDPQSGTNHNGGFTLIGSCTDDSELASIKVTIGKNGNAKDAEGLYSWQYTVNSIFSLATADFSKETSPGSGIWNLPIKIEATDSIGNLGTLGSLTETYTYYLQLEPAGDIPIISVLNPDNGAITGGAIRIYGTAVDDDMVKSVEFELDSNGNGYFASDGDTDDNTYIVEGKNNWYVLINETGDLESTTPREQVIIKYRVKVTDSKDGGTTGDVSSDWLVRTLIIDNTIPTFENIRIDYDSSFDGDYSDGLSRDYSIGMVVKDTIYLDFTVSDDSGIASLYRIDSSPVASTTLLDGATYDVESGVDENGSNPWRHIRIPIDTTAFYPVNSAANGSGSFTLSLKVTDNATPNPYVQYQNLTILVDNRYPEEGSGGYSGDSDVSGNFLVQGQVTDSGSVQGIEKVEFFLLKDGQFYHPATAASTTAVNENRGNLWDIEDSRAMGSASMVSLNLPVPGYLVSIDDSVHLGQDGANYNWYSSVNGASMPDGPMELYYIISDNAGNSSFYVKDLYLMNNPPLIESIELGTDLDFNGSIDADEYSLFSSSYDATDFTVRNHKLDVRINKVAGSGNGNIRYSLKDGLGTVHSGTMATDSATISISSFEADVSGNGAHFDLLLYDSTVSDDTDSANELNQSGTHDNTSLLTLGMNLQNTDLIDPSIALAPFGQYYSDSDDDSLKILVPVSAYSENIGSLGGHVEYGADSLYDSGDADISGQVVFYGKVEDNQQVHSITATIPGYNGGNVFNLLVNRSIQNDGNSGNDWIFESYSDYMTEANGEVYNWKFTFDSSKISGLTANNVVFSFSVYDGPIGTGGTNSAEATLQADVVSYITDIGRANGNMKRSKYGKYPVQSAETLTLYGYNLSSDRQIVDDLLLSRLAYRVDGTSGAPGENGMPPISAINNSNDNTAKLVDSDLNHVLFYNHMDDAVADETNLSDSHWTDDISFVVWSTGDYFPGSDNSFVGYPSMSQDGTGKLYAAWTERSANQLVYSQYSPNSGIDNLIPIYKTLDPPEYTDIYLDDQNDVNIAYLTNYQSGGTGAGANWGWMAVYTDMAPAASYNDAVAAGYYGVESERDNLTLLQFQNPRLVIDNKNNTNSADDVIHLAYYDSYSATVKYSHFVDDGSGAVQVNSSNNAKGFLELDGSEAGGSVQFDGISPSSAAGEFLSIDLDEENFPVIMYYDNANSTLRLARSGTTDPTAEGDWTIQDVFLPGDPYKYQSGSHVMMKIDSNGNIHGVCYNSNTTDLLYLYAEDKDGGTAYTFNPAVVIDDQGASGEGADLVLHESGSAITPYVSYHYLNKMSTKEGLKYAYPLNISNRSSAWEYMIVPLSAAIQGERTNIEYNKGSNWTGTIAIGYLSSRFELIYLR